MRGGASGGISIWGVHWPGDHESKAVSFAMFNDRIPKAYTSGQMLSEQWLSDRRGKRIVLIAHSLGCRVALEAVRWLRTHSVAGVEIDAVFLMAAAVPVRQC